MTEQPFGQEFVQPAEDTVQQSHVPGMAENVYSQHVSAIGEADSQHEAMMNLARQNSALMAKLARYEAPQEVVTAPAGGAPVAHHLHLVDGRTVINHGGIATHWSETLSDGSTRVTRIKEYYPANEPDPTTLYA